jgi:molybdopterin-containing oxidoreductase family membrane subunit
MNPDTFQHDAPAPLILGRPSYGQVTTQVNRLPLRGALGLNWLVVMTAGLAVSVMGLISIAWLLLWGVGIWGINIPIGWGFAITNFVWWIGIGHAGTLISAILLLLHQRWRRSINRFAEAMTLFAVANAGLFPLLHLGRPWRFYYVIPYPDTMGLWPQWRSPLTWDVMAILTYFTVSLIFWYLGLLPDIASARDQARRRRAKLIYGILALGWRGSANQWNHHQTAYLLLAGLATPLVVSVHSIVSLDFASALVPGWQTTIFPPYFVAGAIFSGMAMVFTLAIPMRRFYRLHNLITERHLNAMAKVMLVSGLIVSYGYIMETFVSLFSGDAYHQYMLINRATGPYATQFWIMLSCNMFIPQLLWIYRVRITPWMLFVLSIIINIGMWTERYVIIITSLHRDYMPSAWGMFAGTVWDWTLLGGTLGFFGCAFLLFVRLLPPISMYELRELIWEDGKERGESS